MFTRFGRSTGNLPMGPIILTLFLALLTQFAILCCLLSVPANPFELLAALIAFTELLHLLLKLRFKPVIQISLPFTELTDHVLLLALSGFLFPQLSIDYQIPHRGKSHRHDQLTHWTDKHFLRGSLVTN
jgi:hypothetical protein